MTHNIDILHGNRLKTGDNRPELRIQLYENGYPFNLSEFGYSTVTLKLRRSDADTNKVDEIMEVVDPTRGLVTYEWTNEDTGEHGTYLLEVVAENGEKEVSWPSTGYGRMYITERI